jgi:hypothetical protein
MYTVFNSIALVATLLAGATYQAMYAAPVVMKEEEDVAVASGSKPPVLDWAFRMVNGISFLTSLLSLMACIIGMQCLCYAPRKGDDGKTAGGGQPVDDATFHENNYILSMWAYMYITNTLLNLAGWSLMLAMWSIWLAAMFGSIRYMGKEMGVGGIVVSVLVFLFMLGLFSSWVAFLRNGRIKPLSSNNKDMQKPGA